MRLIDADELKIDYGFTWDDIVPTHKEMYELIDRQPTIDAEPIRHGHWVEVEVHNGTYRCSACGVMDGRVYDTDAYCPNCGAKMDEVVE